MMIFWRMAKNEMPEIIILYAMWRKGCLFV
jgi:hypothetical protein